MVSNGQVYWMHYCAFHRVCSLRELFSICICCNCIGVTNLALRWYVYFALFNDQWFAIYLFGSPLSWAVFEVEWSWASHIGFGCRSSAWGLAYFAVFLFNEIQIHNSEFTILGSLNVTHKSLVSLSFIERAFTFTLRQWSLAIIIIYAFDTAARVYFWITRCVYSLHHRFGLPIYWAMFR